MNKFFRVLFIIFCVVVLSFIFPFLMNFAFEVNGNGFRWIHFILIGAVGYGLLAK